MNKQEIASSLPTVAVYNFRSLFPKLENVKTDILNRNISLAFCCEIWEKPGDEKQESEIESMLQINGLQYLSTPRPRGWGGAAVIVNLERFSVKKLECVTIPKNLDVVWCLLTSKSENPRFKTFVICSFYSPPKCGKNRRLADHLVTTLHMLSSKYPESPIILGADRNSMDVEPILTSGLRL